MSERLRTTDKIKISLATTFVALGGIALLAKQHEPSSPGPTQVPTTFPHTATAYEIGRLDYIQNEEAKRKTIFGGWNVGGVQILPEITEQTAYIFCGPAVTTWFPQDVLYQPGVPTPQPTVNTVTVNCPSVHGCGWDQDPPKVDLGTNLPPRPNVNVCEVFRRGAPLAVVDQNGQNKTIYYWNSNVDR